MQQRPAGLRGLWEEGGWGMKGGAGGSGREAPKQLQENGVTG